MFETKDNPRCVLAVSILLVHFRPHSIDKFNPVYIETISANVP